MSDLSGYREKVKQYGMAAVAAEDRKDYENAKDCYLKACDVLVHLIKCTGFSFLTRSPADEKNSRLVSIFKEKLSEYMGRAEEIAKYCQKKEEKQAVPQPTPSGGSGGGEQ